MPEPIVAYYWETLPGLDHHWTCGSRSAAAGDSDLVAVVAVAEARGRSTGAKNPRRKGPRGRRRQLSEDRRAGARRYRGPARRRLGVSAIFATAAGRLMIS